MLHFSNEKYIITKAINIYCFIETCLKCIKNNIIPICIVYNNKLENDFITKLDINYQIVLEDFDLRIFFNYK